MNSTSGGTLLEAAYKSLGYADGDLQDTSKLNPLALTLDDWVAKGAWLTLGETVGAEKILFVRNNPVIVFARLDTDDAEVLRRMYNNIWCMARPRLLFLAKPGELAVYDLADTPVRTNEEWRKRTALGLAHDIREVADRLRAYRREQVESGLLFEASRFGAPEYRADKSLIRDLKTVRAALAEEGLTGDKLKYAHALIGRSIFIRYLEDRNILMPEYFNDVAKSKGKWLSLLEKKLEKPDIDSKMEKLRYPRVLGDKDFTYTLFAKLARDFNGDMFPEDADEQDAVTQNHLSLLQRFLLGDIDIQRKLFFYAYRFNIIPIELISNIYEEFYQEENGKQKTQASYYTPPALVEFILSQVLTSERLRSSPKIVDPACGSGIFLVEAFKRIVRYRHYIEKRRPAFQDLFRILRSQIAGIDINPEAVRVTAFSLYLAALNYLEPPDILNHLKEGNILPHLIASESKYEQNSLNILISANAFGVDKITSEVAKDRFSSTSADIVIGNPPWGAPNQQDKIAVQANAVALDWCAEHGYPVGDKDRSQAFLWRAKDLLRPNGTGALLVSTGMLFKRSDTSTRFRRKLLSSITIESIFNLAHTRRFFFRESSSPFAVVIFKNTPVPNTDHLIHYWSAKGTANVESLQAVLLDNSDVRLLKHSHALENDKIWKIYWWGNHQDEALIQYLSMFDELGRFTKKELVGRGFDVSGGTVEAEWLQDYRALPTDKFQRYGPLDFSFLEEVPKRVYRRGNRNIYDGLRLLVKRGIEEKTPPKGRIIARIENQRFCFRNSIHGIKLTRDEDWRYKIILGILWSSLARYYFFLTSSSWGIWHHDIHQDELLSLPVRFPENQRLRDELLQIVDTLETWHPANSALFNSRPDLNNNVPPELIELENQLDDAVFKLYELSEAEQDLVLDLCNIGIEYYYGGSSSEANKPIITKEQDNVDLIDQYIKAFLDTWSRQLDPEDGFDCQIIVPSEKGMLAVLFKVQKKVNVSKGRIRFSDKEWNEILRNPFLLAPFHSRGIYLDGVARVVTSQEILVIKRNEKRFWTRSMAREDAEATLVQAMNRELFVRRQL